MWQRGGTHRIKAREIPHEEGQARPDHIPRKLLMEEGSKEICRLAEARTGPRPVCQEPQVYNRRMSWGSLSWPSSRLQDCGAFRALSSSKRGRLKEEQRGCVTCLSWTHPNSKCPLKEPKTPGLGTVFFRYQEKEGMGVCGQTHHRMLHGSKAATPRPTRYWELLEDRGSLGQTGSWEDPWAASQQKAQQGQSLR